MAHQYKVGEINVSMNRGMYCLYLVSEQIGEYGWGGSKVESYYSREDAHQVQYMMNGWGFPEWTVGKSEHSKVLAALDVIRRHQFNRSAEYDHTPIRERIAKANVDCFKALLGMIATPEKVAALKALWIDCYNFYNSDRSEREAFEARQREYRNIACGLKKAA